MQGNAGLTRGVTL